jgi:hypothetical protein
MASFFITDKVANKPYFVINLAALPKDLPGPLAGQLVEITSKSVSSVQIPSLLPIPTFTYKHNASKPYTNNYAYCFGPPTRQLDSLPSGIQTAMQQ